MDAVEVVDPVEELADETVDRVAGIDVAKASGMVAVRLPHDTRAGRRTQQVITVPATTGAILELADLLATLRVRRVVMEATSVYWKPWFFLLESRGLSCWLVNARDVKNVPGRPKTDKLDAVWLAKLTEKGMLRPSFVPPKPVRQSRDLTRTRTVFAEDRTRAKQRGREAAGGRTNQAVLGGHRRVRRLRAGHDGRRDRRGASPPGPGRSRPGANEGQARRPGRRADRHLRAAPRRPAGAAASDRRPPERADRQAHRADRTSPGRDRHARGPRQRSRWRRNRDRHPRGPFPGPGRELPRRPARTWPSAWTRYPASAPPPHRSCSPRSAGT